MRHALLDPTSTVTNIVEWDGTSRYPLPDGYRLIQWAAPAGIGSTWDGTAFSAPPAAPAPEPAMPTGGQLIAAITDTQAKAVQAYLSSATLATQAWWSSRYDQAVPVDAPKFVRIAQKAAIDPAAWYRAATGA